MITTHLAIFFFDGASVGASVPEQQRVVLVGDGVSWQDHVKALNDQKYLEKQLKVESKKLRKVEKQIAKVEKNFAKNPEGILYNLNRLEARREEIITKIQQINIQFDFPVFEDDDDTEVMLLGS